LDIALSVACGLAASAALIRVVDPITLCIAATNALSEAVVNTGDIDTAIAFALTTDGTLVFAHGFGQQSAVFAASTV